MLLIGQPITAKEAYNAGLVSRLVEEDKVDDEVKNICAAIASKPRGVITLGKRFYQQQVSGGEMVGGVRYNLYGATTDRDASVCCLPSRGEGHG